MQGALGSWVVVGRALVVVVEWVIEGQSSTPGVVYSEGKVVADGLERNKTEGEWVTTLRRY